MGSARDFLKQQTSQSHQKLDETELVKGLVEGTLSAPAYETLLRGYHAFFSPIEEKLQASHPEIVRELGAFRFEKTRWLEEDITALGQGITMPAIAPFELPEDPARIAGCLYVVEGSTLGGMHLSRSGRGFPKGAGRFYQGYGDQTMPAWKTFIGWLEGSVDASAQARAADAAIEVFDWFQRTFTLLAHDPVAAPRREG